MSSQFPKLKNKLDEIQFRLDQVLRDEFIDNKLIENVELRFTLKDFVERSNQSDAILSLVQTLKDLGFSNKKSKKIDQADISKITKKHVLAAQSLLKSGSNEKLATKVLIAATSSNNKHTAEKATEALGEFSLKVGAVSSFGDDCDDQGRCK